MKEGLAFYKPSPVAGDDAHAVLVGGTVQDEGGGFLRITPSLWVFLRSDPSRAEITSSSNDAAMERLRKRVGQRARPPHVPVILWIASLMRDLGFDDLGTVPQDPH